MSHEPGNGDCVVNREMISSVMCVELCVAELCDWGHRGCRAEARDLIVALIPGLKAGIIPPG